MSYISKRGKDAAISATTEKQDASKALASFKSGTTYKVRLATAEDYVEYYAASVFGVFTTTPVKPGNLYQKASDVLYAEAKRLKDAGRDAEAEEVRNQAYQLKPKQRYLFGFINLEDGQPIIVDVSKKQAKALIPAIDKYAKRISKAAFELSKTGTGQSTTVSLLVLDVDDDLTDAERKNFEESAGKTIPDELFENCLVEKTLDEQAQDLIAFGFDVSRIGYSAGVDEEEGEPEVEF